MLVRVWPRLGLAVVLTTGACAPELEQARVDSPLSAERPSRAQIYDRDRTLVAGLATSLALGIVGLGTVLASGIYAAPGDSQPHAPPRAMLVAGGIMSAGFLTMIPFAIGVERHRARYPDLFPNQRGRTRVPAPSRPPPSLSNLHGTASLSHGRTAAGPSLPTPTPGLRPLAPGPGQPAPRVDTEYR